jgi:hypothetical protein
LRLRDVPDGLVLWLETSSSHAVYEKEVHLIVAPSGKLWMRLAPTPLDRCPAGFACLLTWLLLRGRLADRLAALRNLSPLRRQVYGRDGS